MRIVYVTDTFAVCGGIERVLTDKMNFLSKNPGYDVTLLTIYQGTHTFPFVLDDSVRHIDIRVRLNQQYEYRGLSRLFKKTQILNIIKSRLKSFIIDFKPDIIVCVKLDFVGVLLSVKGDIPIVVESHTLCYAEKFERAGILRRIHLWKIRRDIRRVEALVALTDGDANDWRRLNSNVHVIPNIVHLNDTDTYSNCLSKTVMFVGRLSKQKNIGGLLDIWKRVYNKNPDWELHIYGEIGDLEGDVYDKLLTASCCGVVVHEAIKGNLIEEYKKHSILVLTSHFEPFGLVIPEAMSCSLPVVSYDSPYGPNSIISDGIDGFLINYNDENAFIEKLCLLIENESLRKEMGKAAIAASNRYLMSSIMPLWIDLFESIINRPRFE